MEDKKFNPINKKKLNNPQRLRFIPISRIVEILNIKESGNLVDYGAGTGYLTFPIAEYFPDSRVFALDIEELMIEEMNKTSYCDNVFPLQIQDNEMPFSKNDLSAVWSIAVYHEMKKPGQWLRNVYSSLKPEAKVLIIDWSIDQAPKLEIGPPISHRVDANTVIADLEKAGFKNIQIEKGFMHHFALSAQKI